MGIKDANPIRLSRIYESQTNGQQAKMNFYIKCKASSKHGSVQDENLDHELLKISPGTLLHAPLA